MLAMLQTSGINQTQIVDGSRTAICKQSKYQTVGVGESIELQDRRRITNNDLRTKPAADRWCGFVVRAAKDADVGAALALLLIVCACGVACREHVVDE